MKVPRYLSFEALPPYVSLPAVSALAAGGFLCESAPLVRIGTARAPTTYVLLSFQQCRYLESVYPVLARDPYTRTSYGEPTVWRPGGGAAVWFNGERRWVSVPWLRSLEPAPPDQWTNGGRLMALLLESVP